MSADKKQIWVNGQLIEVSDEVYDAYMKSDRKIRYFETDLKTERTIIGQDGRIEKIIPSREDSLNRLVDDNAEQFPDHAQTVEELVFRRMTAEALHKALGLLEDNERDLIIAIFFKNKTEREYAEQLGIYRNAVHKRKIRILEKLKKLLE